MTGTPPVPDHLRDFLAERSVPCPGCGYDLRGLQTDRCPECNQVLELQVRLAEPKWGAFIAAVIGATLGAGFAGLFFLLGIIVVAVEGWSAVSDELRAFAALGAMFLACTAVVTQLVRNRKVFQRAPRGWRTAVVVACWGLTAVGFTVIVTVFR